MLSLHLPTLPCPTPWKPGEGEQESRGKGSLESMVHRNCAHVEGTEGMEVVQKLTENT